jgi:hexosaminidase
MLHPAARLDARKLQPGLQRTYHEGSVAEVAELAKLPAMANDVAPTVAIPSQARAETFGLRFAGYLRVPADGVYRFALNSDDGAVLRIDGETVVDRDGPRSPGESYGSTALAAGLHQVELDYFQGGGGRELKLSYSREREDSSEVPADWLWH